jgi:hypothetical protein
VARWSAAARCGIVFRQKMTFNSGSISYGLIDAGGYHYNLQANCLLGERLLTLSRRFRIWQHESSRLLMPELKDAPTGTALLYILFQNLLLMFPVLVPIHKLVTS